MTIRSPMTMAAQQQQNHNELDDAGSPSLASSLSQGTDLLAFNSGDVDGEDTTEIERKAEELDAGRESALSESGTSEETGSNGMNDVASEAGGSEVDDESSEDDTHSNEDETDSNGNDSEGSEGDSNGSEDDTATEDASSDNESSSSSEDEEDDIEHDKRSYPMIILAKAKSSPTITPTNLEEAQQVTQHLLKGLSREDRDQYEHAIKLDQADIRHKTNVMKRESNSTHESADKMEKLAMEEEFKEKALRQRTKSGHHASVKLLALIQARKRGSIVSAAAIMGHRRGRKSPWPHARDDDVEVKDDTTTKSTVKPYDIGTNGSRALRSAEGMGTLPLLSDIDGSDNDFDESCFDDSFEAAFGSKKRKEREDEGEAADQDAKRMKRSRILGL